MLQHIIDYSLRNKLIIGLFIAGLVVMGSYQLTLLPIDAVPDITDNQVQIITTSPALGAPDVERLITYPIEQACLNLPDLKNIRSFSRFGLSVVTVVFKEKTDIYWARQQVNERIQQVRDQVPSNLGVPYLAPLTTGLGEIYQYTIRPDKGFEHRYTLSDLRTIQDWIVRKQLMGTEGVADVASFGGKLKQYQVSVDFNRLQAHGISIRELFEAVHKNNQNTGGAYIEKGPNVLYIRTEGLLTSISDIENILLRTLPDGAPILVRDVAEVVESSAIRYGAMTYNGESEVAGAVVMMLKGANSNLVIKRVKERIEEIKANLPEGILIEPFLDRTKMVNNAISTVQKNLLEGALIVVFILVLFLGNLRAGFIVASVIPLSMLFAISMMNLFGVSGNLMSLGALDFGLIVDGAVIIVEAVMHHLQKSNSVQQKALSHKENKMDKVVGAAAGRMMNSAVFGQIVILIVYLPILSLEGIEGKMFKPMAQTVSFALIGAFLLSLTYVPVATALFIKSPKNDKMSLSDRVMQKIEGFYKDLLLKSFAFKTSIIGLVLVLFGFSVVLLSNLGGEFIPELPEGDFAVETRLLTGSSLSSSIDLVLKSQKVLLEKFPEIEKVVGKTGSSEIPTDPMPVENTDLMIILKPRSEWTTASTYDELAEKMHEALDAIPGVSFSFQYPVAMRFNELMTGAKQDVVCKLFGEDLDTLAKIANKMGQLAQSIEGSADVYVEPVNGMPQIVISYKRTMLVRYGLSIEDVNNVVNTAYAGQVAGQVLEGEKRFDLVIRLSDSKRLNEQDIENLLIETPSGIQVPLNAVADISLLNGVNQIQREKGLRRISVGLNAKGKDVESIVKEWQQKAAKSIQLPYGYYFKFGGSFENLNDAKARLTLAVPVALALIFILLYFAFHSLAHGLLIYTAIPLSSIGGILALWARDMPFSISAGVGFIALFGVAVLNGIVLMAEFNKQKLINPEVDLLERVLNACSSRLRPVLLTAMVASFGFLPMALSNGEGAEVQRPLATVVIGGLLLATFLTLFVLPIAYYLLEKRTMKNLKLHNSAFVLFCFIGISSVQLQAQKQLTVQECIDIAIKNNKLVQSERYNYDAQKKLISTSYDLPKTDFGYQSGQINSVFSDNLFSISQSMAFPTVYAQQRKVLQNSAKSASIMVEKHENELKYEIRKAYYTYSVLSEKLKLINEVESIYQKFKSITDVRFNAGEVNALESLTAENKLQLIEIQKTELKAEMNQVNEQIQLLTGSVEPIIPNTAEYKVNKAEWSQNLVQQNPLIRLTANQIELSKQKIKLERSKLLPDLFAGYNNISFLGMGADDIFYSSRTTRFQSFQFGLSIPVFFKSQHTRVSAEKIAFKQAESLNEWVNQLQTTKWKQIQNKENAADEVVKKLESKALLISEQLIEKATMQLQQGEINFIQWAFLADQSIQIKIGYLDSIQKLNDARIELLFITQQ